MKKFLTPLLFLFFSFNLIAQSFMVPVNLQLDINQIEYLGEDVIVYVDLKPNKLVYSRNG